MPLSMRGPASSGDKSMWTSSTSVAFSTSIRLTHPSPEDLVLMEEVEVMVSSMKLRMVLN